MNIEKCCCVFGHREIENEEELEIRVYEIAERLITEEAVEVFLFESKSQFNDLCYEVITRLKEKYSQIKRVYVRAEYPNISGDYERHLLQKYEYTYYPKKCINAGRSIYVKRNIEMIDKSKFCIVYFEDNQAYRSGTKIAYEDAKIKGKYILTVGRNNNPENIL